MYLKNLSHPVSEREGKKRLCLVLKLYEQFSLMNMGETSNSFREQQGGSATVKETILIGVHGSG